MTDPVSHPAGPPPLAAAPAGGGRPAPRADGVARRRARLLLVGSSACFGLGAVLVRLATRGGMSGGQVTFVRFVVGLACVLAMFRARPGTFRPVRHWLLVSRGGFGAVAALLYFLSIERIPAGEAALLNNMFPIFAVLYSLVVLDERPTFHLGVALVIASAGVFLVLGGGGGAVTLGLGVGEVLGIASAMVGGAAVTSMRVLRATDNPPTIFFAFTLGGLLVSAPYALGAWPGGLLPWAAAVAVGIVTFFAQLLMTDAYGALSVPEAALLQQLTPVAGYLWGLTLGEPIGVATMVGVALGVAGVVYGSVLGHAPREERSPKAAAARGIPYEEP